MVEEQGHISEEEAVNYVSCVATITAVSIKQCLDREEDCGEGVSRIISRAVRCIIISEVHQNDMHYCTRLVSDKLE